MFDSLKKSIREIHSEPGPGGTLSWGRVASSVSLLAVIVWVSHVLIISHQLPSLEGVTAFSLAPYGANKALTTVQSFSK